MANNMHRFKLVLLGEGAVGKTSLVLRYVENKFTPRHYSTLQASFMTKKLNFNGTRLELNIWDTAGQERFHALGPIYYRDSHGAILVYDITDEDSFTKVQNWVKELRRMLGEGVILAVVGNKLDLSKERRVQVTTAAEYAKSVGAIHHECSAKTNVGIEELFFNLAKRMLENTPSPSKQNLSNNRSNNILIVDDGEFRRDEPKKTCCQ